MLQGKALEVVTTKVLVQTEILISFTPEAC